MMYHEIKEQIKATIFSNPTQHKVYGYTDFVLS